MLWFCDVLKKTKRQMCVLSLNFVTNNQLFSRVDSLALNYVKTRWSQTGKNDSCLSLSLSLSHHSLAYFIIHSHSLECSGLLRECWFIRWEWSSNIWIFGWRQNHCPPISMNVHSGKDSVRSGWSTKVYHSDTGVVVAGNAVVGRRRVQKHRTDLVLRMGINHCNKKKKKKEKVNDKRKINISIITIIIHLKYHLLTLKDSNIVT